MIIHKKIERMSFLSSFLIYYFIILFIFITSNCFFINNYDNQMTIEKFEPFVLKENMLLIRNDTINQISIIDTDIDEIIKRIRIYYANAVYSIIAGNKIYVMDEGLPVRDSYTVCAIYPDKGTYKQIRLDYPLPSGIIFNPISKKLVVEHGSFFNDSGAKKRGGTYPISIINTENDTLEKTIWSWEKYYFINIKTNGEFFLVEFGNNVGKIVSLDVITEKTNILDIHFRPGGEGGWESYFDHTAGTYIYSNLLFVGGFGSNLIKVYDINTGKVVDSVELPPPPHTNFTEYPYYNYSIDCVAYYHISNYLFVGGCSIAVIDMNTKNVIKWITNYRSRFKLSNHKLYILCLPKSAESNNVIYLIEDYKIDVLSITNDFKLIRTFKREEW